MGEGIKEAVISKKRGGTMNLLKNNILEELLKEHEKPCLSIYQPTHRHRPEKQQDPIRFRNLLNELEKSLRKTFQTHKTEPLMEPFYALAENFQFWNYTLDGLAVFGAPGFFRFYSFQRSVPELIVAADNFHTKPLLRILQSADRYQILALSRDKIRLFEGNRDILDELEPPEEVPRTLTKALGEELTEPHLTVSAYGDGPGSTAPMYHGHGGRPDQIDIDTERFFRAVDRAVLKHVSNSSGLPLMLAALPEYHGIFRQISRNPFLMKKGVEKNPDAFSLDELRDQAWQVVLPEYLARLNQLIERFDEAKPKDLGSDQVPKVAEAAVGSRVETVLIEADRRVPGRLNIQTGEIQFNNSSTPETNDLLDDIAQLVLKLRGNVVVVPAENMPSSTGIAAIYRF
jgi:hypothetical protein